VECPQANLKTSESAPLSGEPPFCRQFGGKNCKGGKIYP